MKRFHSQPSFATGLFSPLLQGREDDPQYDYAVKSMKNMLALSQGPAMRRQGTVYTREIPLSGAGIPDEGKARAFDFPVLGTTGFFVVVTWNSTLYIVDRDGNDVQEIAGTPWDGEEIAVMQAEPEPDTEDLWLTSPKREPWVLSYDAVAGDFTLATSGLTGLITSEGFPVAITFLQGRCWLGGAPGDPATFFGSTSTDLRDFTIGANADDGLRFTLRRHGKIQWLQGIRDLLVGSTVGEFVVTSAAGVITPGDVDAPQQSAYGSTSTPAVAVGNVVLHVNLDGSKLYDMDYRFNGDETGWISTEVSYNVQGLVDEVPIRELAWSQHPYNLLWMAPYGSQGFVCTYDRGARSFGWSTYETNGDLISFASLSTENHPDRMCWVVERENGVFLELLDAPRVDGVGTYLDSAETIEGDQMTSVTIPRFANARVSIVTDGSRHPDEDVPANGVVPLDYPADVVVVGYSYESELTLLPLRTTHEQRQMSDAGWQKSWGRVLVQILNSWRPMVNGLRRPTRHQTTVMGEAEPLRTEETEYNLSGWSVTAPLTIVTDDPGPLTITKLMGEVADETL